MGDFDNVMSAADAVFRLTEEFSGEPRGPEASRAHLLDVNAIVIGKQLQVSWTYNRNVHDHDTIQALAERCFESLRSLILHCCAPDAGGHTPSDFPLAVLNQATLDSMLTTLPPDPNTRAARCDDIYPLTGTQQGLLFHSVYAPSSGVYVQQLRCVLTGPLDVAGFQAAWAAVVARHAVLRTAFVWKQVDAPLQVVRAQVTVPWTVEDWQGWPPAVQAARLTEVLAADAAQGFELTAAPLMRCRLLRTGPTQYHFVWSHHHLLLDGWSVPLVLQDVQAAYAAHCQGHPVAWGPPPRPYREYVAWTQQQPLAAGEAYWRAQLRGVQTPTPVGGQVPAAATPPQYAVYEQTLAPAPQQALERFVRAQRVTLNTALQAAWAALLSWYSGDADVLFGVTVAGRPATLPGVERMVGVFINTLPVRLRVPTHASLGAWLAAVQAQHVASQPYEWIPLATLQRWSDVPRGQALFESLLVFENYPVERTAPDARVTIHDIAVTERTNYPLTLLVVPGEVVRLRWNYDAGRFTAAEIATRAQHLERLLATMAHAGAAQPVRRLRQLSSAERTTVVTQGRGPETAYAGAATLPAHFAATAAATPDAIAVASPTGQVSYAALQRRARHLAHHLQHTYGVGPDTVVGVCLARGLDLVVALLAVGQAGGAYVALDPAQPPPRLARLVHETQARCVLTHTALAAALPAAVPVVPLDTLTWPPALPPRPWPRAPLRPAHLAYVLYTSGSTGQPKGVMIPQQGIRNRLCWMQATYPLTPTDRVLQKTPFTFDVSVWEFFWPLLTGACLVVATPDGHRDSAYLQACLAREEVTTLHFVPSMLRAYLATGATLAPSVRQVFCSGEALPWDVQARARAQLSAGGALHNLYGPTEASVEVTAWPCADERYPGLVPIGRPIANTQAYVVDPTGQPVPPGVAGELVLGGVALARGYCQRPALTAAQFVPDALGATAGARLYRTGDQVRALPPAGALLYLGRRDAQVKIRGVRIELGEVEAALARHPAVHEVVVVAAPDADGGARLIAYVTGGATLPPAAWRAFAQSVLPDALVPAAVVSLAALPRTASGKLDRRALPPPPALPAPATPARAPQTPLERTLATLWADVLHVPQVGLTDNFFDLGGDSISATHILARIHRDIGVDVSLRDLLTRGTIDGIVPLVTTAIADRGERDSPLPVVVDLSKPEELIGSLDKLSEEQLDSVLRDLSPS